ncbi:MAG: DNA cytosine methyltransferase [Lentisphaeraceae bacterium]|nr:DNA cytosine methyltransferase [Lentisphaeraceae bacterium]
MNLNKELTYIDLFSGCGGLGLGLHKAGWKGLFAVEKSPDAFLTLKHNLIDKTPHFDWPDWLPQKDLDINDLLKEYPDKLKDLKDKIDLVAGGPPCQGFSSAGRRNHKDERNTLIDSYVEFIKIVQPKLIFFENVRGFTVPFTHDKSKQKYSSYIEAQLDELGYKVKGKLLNFSKFGVPQSRTRFILVGVKTSDKGYSVEESFFNKLDIISENFLKERNLPQTSNVEEAISDLLIEYGLRESPDSKRFQSGIYGKAQSPYQKLMRNKTRTNQIADSHRIPNHGEIVITRFKYAIKHNLGPQEFRRHFRLKKAGTRLLRANEPTPTLTTLPDDYIHYCEPRILSVREYARIQSFPDTYEIKGKYTTGGPMRVKEVPRYSQIGNAIPPLFAEQAGLLLNKIISEKN